MLPVLSLYTTKIYTIWKSLTKKSSGLNTGNTVLRLPKIIEKHTGAKNIVAYVETDYVKSKNFILGQNSKKLQILPNKKSRRGLIQCLLSFFDKNIITSYVQHCEYSKNIIFDSHCDMPVSYYKKAIDVFQSLKWYLMI